jgi:hypothetical protein
MPRPWRGDHPRLEQVGNGSGGPADAPFQVTPQVQTISLQEFCPTPCANDADCPQQQVLDVSLRLEARARHDRANVSRSINVSTRLRNDAVFGACPAP